MIDRDEQLANLADLRVALLRTLGKVNEPPALHRLFSMLTEVRERIAEIESALFLRQLVQVGPHDARSATDSGATTVGSTVSS